MSTTMCRGFESLAPEILHMIIFELSDLQSLDSLLRSSPTFFRFFISGNSVKIMNSILDSGLTGDQVRVMICVIAHIRSGTLPMSSLTDFQQQVTFAAMENRRIKIGNGFFPLNLPKSTSTTVLLSILASVRRITSLTLNCLDFYLNKFQALKPYHLVDRKFHWKGRQPWNLKPELRPYNIGTMKPVVWTEQQRVFRAFWRLQVIEDIKNAVKNSLINWSSETIKKIGKEEPINLFYDKYLDVFFDLDEPHPEFQEILSAAEYLQRSPEVFNPNQAAIVQTKWLISSPTKSDWRELDDPSPGVRFYYYRVNPGSFFMSAGLQPLDNVSFEFYRRQGFAFWSLDRMVGHRLVPDSIQGAADQYQGTFYIFAWRSILSADEIAEQENYIRATHDPNLYWGGITEFSGEEIL